MPSNSLITRTRLVYALLGVALAVILGWQALEHQRVVKAAENALLNRSQDITSTLGLVVRSQRRWGAIMQERLESSLKELVGVGEVSSIALLNAAGEIVVAAGEPIGADIKTIVQRGELWEGDRVLIGNLVDLGSSVTREGETNSPTVVLPPRDPEREQREREQRDRDRDRQRNEENTRTNQPQRAQWGRGGMRRPPWMTDDMLQRRGLHGMVMAMPTTSVSKIARADLVTRGVISAFAALAVLGLGVAWRNIVASSELQMRLVRASEMNTHLQELSVAAAGLAHETRNPLNIIRGLAQMISKTDDASTEVRRKTREIISETDRVTAQLNEFINYSRPREVRPAPVALGEVVGEVSRALTYDLEEKVLRLRVPEKLPTIEADEQLLRQTLFNLMLNAVQAVERGGEIEVAVQRDTAKTATIDIRDNGPGVLESQRQDIFKPYFTTHQKGTGLGLAVVQQIVLAHGWEIECLANEPRGAIFRISHVKLAE